MRQDQIGAPVLQCFADNTPEWNQDVCLMPTVNRDVNAVTAFIDMGNPKVFAR